MWCLLTDAGTIRIWQASLVIGALKPSSNRISCGDRTKQILQQIFKVSSMKGSPWSRSSSTSLDPVEFRCSFNKMGVRSSGTKHCIETISSVLFFPAIRGFNVVSEINTDISFQIIKLCTSQTKVNIALTREKRWCSSVLCSGGEKVFIIPVLHDMNQVFSAKSGTDRTFSLKIIGTAKCHFIISAKFQSINWLQLLLCLLHSSALKLLKKLHMRT